MSILCSYLTVSHFDDDKNITHHNILRQYIDCVIVATNAKQSLD